MIFVLFYTAVCSLHVCVIGNLGYRLVNVIKQNNQNNVMVDTP